jgi:hypothetical protein
MTDQKSKKQRNNKIIVAAESMQSVRQSKLLNQRLVIGRCFHSVAAELNSTYPLSTD